MRIVFPCGTGTASWSSTTDAQKRPTSPGEWYPLALKPSYYFSQMFGAVYLPDWNGTGCNSTIRNNWSESCCVLPLIPTIWTLPMRLMRLPPLIKRHCQHHPILLYITFLLYYYIFIYIFVPPFLPITKLEFSIGYTCPSILSVSQSISDTISRLRFFIQQISLVVSLKKS